MRKQGMLMFSALILLLSASPVYAWRCDHGLVIVGDSAGEVRKKCGAPDYIFSDAGVYRRGKFTATDERWYYNYGPRLLMQELHMHKGVLKAVDTPAYGFRSTSKRCTPQDVSIGMSAYELISRCGKPKKIRERYTRIGSGKVFMHTEAWTYDFGSQYLLQRATIISGHISHVEALSRTKHHAKRLS